jgi:hypothetical protein
VFYQTYLQLFDLLLLLVQLIFLIDHLFQNLLLFRFGVFFPHFQHVHFHFQPVFYSQLFQILLQVAEPLSLFLHIVGSLHHQLYSLDSLGLFFAVHEVEHQLVVGNGSIVFEVDLLKHDFGVLQVDFDTHVAQQFIELLDVDVATPVFIYDLEHI